MRLLVLGGTGFIGPHYVRAAVARGHHVSVFTRGSREPDASLDVGWLVGDRRGDISSIAGREWDAVLDLAACTPRWVRTLGETLGGRVNHYTFVSTIATYADYYGSRGGTADIDEDAEVLEYAGTTDPYADPDLFDPGELDFGALPYGSLKILCEREAERQFAARTLVVRPGYIVGPGDPQGWMSYWLRRLQREGEVVVLGEPEMQVQFIDVRDLAEWTVRMVEQGETGTYNAVGPAARMTLAEMLGSIRGASSTPPPDLTWVPASWLLEREDVGTWGRVLFWSAAPDRGYAPGMRIRAAKAMARGLTFRPFADTASAQLTWEDKHAADATESVAVAQTTPGDRDAFVALPWDAYLEREQQLLADWHHLAGSGPDVSAH